MDKVLEFIIKNEIGHVKESVDISNYTTYRIGGKCRVFVEPYSLAAFVQLIEYIIKFDYKYFILGNGSNIIVPEDLFDVIFIKFTFLNKYSISSEYIDVDAGCLLPKIALDLAKIGISCFEFASGIPGSVGGAIFMNAGAYGEEIADHIISATVFDKKNHAIVELDKSEMHFSYRHSIFHDDNFIILSGKFVYKSKEIVDILNLINNRRRRRIETQPIGEATAGSVFRNFTDVPTWKIIDECGLREHRIGGAMVSAKHCNMIVNVDNAKSKDIINLINHIKTIVYNKTGRSLILEQRIIEWSD